MKHALIHGLTLLMLLCLVHAVPRVSAGTPDTMTISAGESRVVKTDFAVDKIAIGDPAICGAVKTGDRELLINAKKPGQSNVLIWGGDDRKVEIQVIVRSPEMDNIETELIEITKDIEGVRVRKVGSRVFVEGEVFTHNSMKRVERIVEGMPNVVNLVEFSPTMKEIVKSEIEKSLASQGMNKVKVTVTKNTFMLTGTVTSDEESERARRIAEAYAPDIVNAIAVKAPVVKPKEEAPPPPPPKAILIEMALNIMEIEKEALRDVGIHWNPGGNIGGSGSYSGAKGSSPSLSGALSGTINNLMPKMRKINETGRGRSLMQQTLITKNGDEAEFFAGSEIPIQVAQEGGTMSVEYKKVGVTLKFQPDLDYYQNIVSSINVESSSVTGAGPGGVPVISNTNMQTVISVPSGSSVALGGLIGQRELAAVSASPPDKGLSVAQANQGNRNETTLREVIIFVTPRVLDGKPQDTVKVQKKIEGDFKQQELEQLRKQAN